MTNKNKHQFSKQICPKLALIWFVMLASEALMQHHCCRQINLGQIRIRNAISQGTTHSFQHLNSVTELHNEHVVPMHSQDQHIAQIWLCLGLIQLENHSPRVCQLCKRCTHLSCLSMNICTSVQQSCHNIVVPFTRRKVQCCERLQISHGHTINRPYINMLIALSD